MKKTPILSMQKFTSAAVYFFILSIGLTVLMQRYGESVLTGNNALANPLVFAYAVLVLGILISLIYWAFNCLLKVVMTAIFKKETNGLNALSVEESTMIGVVTSIIFGVMSLVISKGNPELSFMHQMLFSLPIAKLAFITTSISEMKTAIIELLKKSARVWPFLIYIIIYLAVMLISKRFATLINTIITTGVVILFLHEEAKRLAKGKHKPHKNRSSEQ